MLYKTETTLPLLWRQRFATYIRLRQNALGGPPVDQGTITFERTIRVAHPGFLPKLLALQIGMCQ